MKNKKLQVVVWAIFMSLPALILLPSSTTAKSSSVEVVLKVSSKGFLDANGNFLNNLLKVPKESDVKLVFEYAGKPGDPHEFALLFESGEEIYSDPLSHQNTQTHIEFFTGRAGEKYDVFCIVDCDWMDYLTDLIVVAI